MKRKIKWLLAGAGDIVKSRVASAISLDPNSELEAVCARTAVRAEEIARTYGAKAVFLDYGEALEKSGADAVYIATPHHLHVPMALDALRAGKHFLSEKPLGIEVEGCRELYRESLRHPGLVASCSDYRLFTSQFRETERIALSGELGALLSGWAHDEEPYYNPSGAPLLAKDGMSPVLGFGYYLIDIARKLFGLPGEVYALFSSFNCAKISPYDIDDVEHVILKFPGGRSFSLFLNMATQGPLRHSYGFSFSSGRVLWPGAPPHFNRPVEVHTATGADARPSSVTPHSGGGNPNWHLPMIEDFTRAVLGGGTPVCTLEGALRTQEIIDAAQRSAREGLPVKCVYAGI